jgi:hypothetical protein
VPFADAKPHDQGVWQAQRVRRTVQRMALGRKRPEPASSLSGADYLLALAHNAAERDQPFAQEFHRMVSAALSPSPAPLYRDAIASRPLREHEASPASIIVGAVQAALTNGDRESAQEALRVGVSLLAKWPLYLDGGVDGHPDLVLRT